MRIDLNGVATTTAASTLAVLIEERGLDANSVATALDGLFVARAARGATVLNEGVKIEILEPMQGG